MRYVLMGALACIGVATFGGFGPVYVTGDFSSLSGGFGDQAFGDAPFGD